MKSALFAFLAAISFTLPVAAQFYGNPPDETHPWAVHDTNRPQPPRVEPGTFSSQDKPGTPPSDAIVLFDGTQKSIANWISAKKDQPKTKWVVKDGALQCVPGSGYIQSKEHFGDCQLHIEWSAPSEVKGDSQGRGNSGVFLMGMTEVQVLDNYDNPTYPDGFAGSVYGVNPPMANPLRKPGEWQIYDIIFRRPVFKDGELVDQGYLTVFVNGVLVQDHTPLEGGGGHKGRSKPKPFPESGSLKLQDHGNPVRYRNIWYRPLPKRPIEGGDGSNLSPEATAAKRAEIAADIRKDAAELEGKAKMLRLYESLCYQIDEAALAEANTLSKAFATEIAAIPEDKLESKKGDIMQVHKAFQYLAKHKILPEAPEAATTLQSIAKKRDWK